ncbi:MAG: methyltransferase domain-containing protein [Thermoplasmata archaeon]|nr:methyltransferase domain-containing protein [Thermoplasmata archaeon]
MAKEAGKSTLKFWGESAKGYKEGVKKELESKNISDKWIRKILENAPEKDRLKVLDIGCGPGFFTINLSKLGHDVIGIDVSKEMVEVARENAQEQGVACDFKVMNANTLEFEDNTFDLIINRVVTWTLPDLYECYREWRRVLAPNGRLIVFDANHYANIFSEERAKQMRLMMRQHILDGKEPFTDHFDFHVRWNYWGDCPMVGTPRPQWDRNMLYKLCFVDIFTEENLFGDTKGSGTSEPMFMIRAEKPSPEEENEFIVNEYWNAIAGCVSARAVQMLEEGRSAGYVDSISKYLKPGSKVADIGTGSGAVAIQLTKNGFDTVGVDRASAMIEMAKLTAEEQKVKVDFIENDAECTDFDDESFDAVVMRNVVWNSFNPENILKEAKRILRKGGVLIITDGNWQENIRKWESENTCHDEFPNYKKRDLGLGAYDIINVYYDRLPLNKECRPSWDEKALSSLGFSIEANAEFDDPMITDDLKPVLKKGFIVVARK